MTWWLQCTRRIATRSTSEFFMPNWHQRCGKYSFAVPSQAQSFVKAIKPWSRQKKTSFRIMRWWELQLCWGARLEVLKILFGLSQFWFACSQHVKCTWMPNACNVYKTVIWFQVYQYFLHLCTCGACHCTICWSWIRQRMLGVSCIHCRHEVGSLLRRCDPLLCHRASRLFGTPDSPCFHRVLASSAVMTSTAVTAHCWDMELQDPGDFQKHLMICIDFIGDVDFVT